MRELLDKMTKQEIIDFIVNLCEDGLMSANVIIQELRPKEITADQKQILQKIANKEQLSADNLSFIADTFKKKENTKVASLLKNKDLFIKELVSYKVKSCFEKIWAIYPRKVGKETGYKAFIKLVSEQKLHDLVNYCEYVAKKVVGYKNQCEEFGTETQYILHFSTFCNSKKYL